MGAKAVSYCPARTRRWNVAGACLNHSIILSCNIAIIS